MAVIQYKRGNKSQLTKHFNSLEFDCKGTRCRCTVTRVDSKLVRKLQVLRLWLGKAIAINSGNRCKTHNAAVGGSSGSYHLNTSGRAADICAAGVAPRELAKLAQELGFTGIGMYDGTAGRFVHVDTRPRKYYWTNISGRNIQCTSHGGTQKKCPYELGTRALKRNDTGDAVRALQWILNWAGFHCKVDGVFGDDTRSMVIEFQRYMQLSADGIVGAKTLEALAEVAG